eukprot:755022_1
MAKEDSSYVYVAIFLLYYTRGTILNHKCSLGCCDPRIDFPQIRTVLPNSIQIDDAYQISFELFECFDVFKMYLEPFLVNLCRKRIISGNPIHHHSNTEVIGLKPNQESDHIYRIMEEVPSSYCDTLHDIVTQKATPRQEDLFTLDTLVTGFRMTELYNVYLHQTLQFRSRPFMIDKQSAN